MPGMQRSVISMSISGLVAPEAMASTAEVIRGLDELQEVEAELHGQRYVLRSQLLGHASQALRGAGVVAPPPLSPGK